jgi:hypothetical protein
MLSVHLFKIKRPERGNQLGNLWKKKHPYLPVGRKPITREEAHARKIASVLRLKAPALANCGSTNNTGR